MRASFKTAGLPRDVTHRPFDEYGLPLIVEPATAALAKDPVAVQSWFEEHHRTLEELLPTYGGVVLRGFAIPDTAAFNAMIERYETDPMGYAGGLTPRSNISGKVFEASRVPADQKIILHQEMGYLPNYPKAVAFYCLIPSETGGCTTIGDARRLQTQISARLMDSVRERGVLYRRNYRKPGPEADPLKALFRREWTDVLHGRDQGTGRGGVRRRGLRGGVGRRRFAVHALPLLGLREPRCHGRGSLVRPSPGHALQQGPAG